LNSTFAILQETAVEKPESVPEEMLTALVETLLCDMAAHNIRASIEAYSIALATALLYTGTT
jgi:hypothetical protein